MVLQQDVFTAIAFPYRNDTASITKLRRYGNNFVLYGMYVVHDPERIAVAVRAKNSIWFTFQVQALKFQNT